MRRSFKKTTRTPHPQPHAPRPESPASLTGTHDYLSRALVQELFHSSSSSEESSSEDSSSEDDSSEDESSSASSFEDADEL